MMYTAYDALYTSLKNRFTVIDGKNECTLGDYLRNKASKNKKNETKNVKNSRTMAYLTKMTGAVQAKMAVYKEKKTEENTITAFPLRTTASVLGIVLSVGLCAFPIVKMKDNISNIHPQTGVSSTVTPTVLEEDGLYSSVNL